MLRTLAPILFLTFSMVSANFDFFGNMFGGQQHHQQQQQQRSGASHWAAQVENVPCSQYLCPATLDCVARPVDCPCPDVQDVKCTIPDSGNSDDATVVCVRGQNECAEDEREHECRLNHCYKDTLHEWAAPLDVLLTLATALGRTMTTLATRLGFRDNTGGSGDS
ncbi:putative long chronological lifespan protein 2 [Lyophyllum shimeji]|uniref:Long chronological lifespan protein 2 n=1 Tax=Lyophyllum shimeji TaxID=47721 RepID=A0A9P3PDK8_LYOSH|nr:putative long chronological lifespan protein 2 [Lyophyllum shimeji]